jgi:hypothetical protein
MRTFIDVSVGLAFLVGLYGLFFGFKKLERGEGVVLACVGVAILVLTIVWKM